MVITVQNTNQKPGYKQTEIGMIPEDWDVKKLEEIGEKFVNGGTPSTQKSEYWQGNIPWITGADIINQKISDIRRFITTEAVKNSSTNIVERGNLLLVTRTGVGKLAVASFDVAISQDITGIYIEKEQASIEYLFHYFNYISETLKSLNQGTSIAGITRETLLSTRVYLPPLTEQRAIATALSDVDTLIASLDKLIAKKRDIKQATMQQLLTGKTRLPGFSGEWKMKKLGERCEIYSGGTPSTSNPAFYGGSIGWITSSDLNRGRIKEVEGRITKLGFEKSSAKMINKGTLLLALYGATAGVAAITEFDAAINQAVLAIIPQKDNSEFLFQKLTFLKDWLIKTYTQGGQPNLSGQIIKLIEFSLPTESEQQAIATVLLDMDAEIAALEQRRDKTRALKQGMMQELLTGKTRLL